MIFCWICIATEAFIASTVQAKREALKLHQRGRAKVQYFDLKQVGYLPPIMEDRNEDG